MRAFPSRGSRPVFLTALGILALLGLLLNLAPAPPLSAQDKKGAKEMPAKKKPGKKAPKREEEEEGDTKPDETRDINLAAEAKKAEGEIKDFLTGLATPHDDVIMPSGRVDRVEPLARYYGPHPNYTGQLPLTRIEKNGKRTRLNPVKSTEVKSILPYEEVALRDVKALLEKPDLARLQAAEKALVYVLRYHNTARKRDPADARVWATLEARLREQLLQVRLDQVDALADAGNWNDAFARAEQLAEDNPRSAPVQLKVARLMLRSAERTGRVEDFLDVRKRMLKIEDQFPRLEGLEYLRRGLKAKADKLLAQANAESDKFKARDLLRQANDIWPQLPGLQEAMDRLDDGHPVLYVGVPSRPTFLSPATAWTDTERQAVELMFEGLVQPTFGPDKIWRFYPALSEGRPQVIPLGREFSLVHDAFWADGKRRVSAADIRHTVQLLKRPNLPGRNDEWDRLVEDPRIEGSSFQVRITLRHGFLDPLSLMTFKVLPKEFPLEGKVKELQRADDADFARHPLGSGPYQLKGEETRGGNQYTIFTANTFYRRPGKEGQPFIREIGFFQSKKPADEFRDGRLHLLLDLPTSRVKELQDAKFAGEIRTLATPRIYFLAVNHGTEALQNQDLRKAIAHAIDREALLNDYFRAGFKSIDREGKLSTQVGPNFEPLDPALNGPYPPDSWACAPASRVPTHLFNLELAQNKARLALAKLGGAVKLTLKYPEGDPRVKKACDDICRQVAKLGAIKIEPVPLPPHQFRKAIQMRDYDLAYCHYDYASDAFWLWPLFDPDRSAREPGGSNYLRYENDGVLQEYFQKVTNRRDFNEIRKLTHDIHAHLYEKMPLIPLWQLHVHVAIHPSLRVGDIDPLKIFPGVEGWKLERR